MYKKNSILLVLVLASLIFSYQYFHSVQLNYLSITTFSECKTAGYNITITYPEVCVMAGKRFINPNQNKQTTNTSPKSNLATAYFKNQGYIIDGEYVYFTDGASHATSSVTTSKNNTLFTIVGDPFNYDLNNDSIVDNIILIKKEEASVNHFSYYISSCISLRDGCTGTNALYLDTSIENIQFVYKNGHIVISYTKNKSKSMTIQKIYGLEDGILKQLSD